MSWANRSGVLLATDKHWSPTCAAMRGGTCLIRLIVADYRSSVRIFSEKPALTVAA